MKVLLINGSPRSNGNTSTALTEITKILNEYEIETMIIHVGNLAIKGCVGCGQCEKLKRCIYEDMINEVAKYFEEADGLIIGSPVYYAGANGTLINFLTRLFHSTKFDKRMKVGASVVAGRRGGLSSTYDELNKFFGIAGMPIVTSQYWNSVHGKDIGEALKDEEGLQTMCTLAHNMAFLMKSISSTLPTARKYSSKSIANMYLYCSSSPLKVNNFSFKEVIIIIW